MIEYLSLTILIDDTPGKAPLLSEHGFALWIEAGDTRILFDTGQTDAFIRNAEVLGIDLGTIDALVLSHGHYDHTGGVAELLRRIPDVPVFCHPGIFVPRYSHHHDDTVKAVGIDKTSAHALHGVIDHIRWVSAPREVVAGVHLTGPVPRKTSFEDVGGAFSLDPQGRQPDPIEDDLSLWVETTKGIVIVTGCCHAGLVNTMEHVGVLTGDTPVHTIIGGFHLIHASTERIDATTDYLSVTGFKRLIPCHCTGWHAVSELNKRFGHAVTRGETGMVVGK
jgi:7,8-dihydropterin-6-yl-methyl-4-(beta-D-ribofuranosyl)aminobenzene 5'-phosphate synthase